MRINYHQQSKQNNQTNILLIFKLTLEPGESLDHLVGHRKNNRFKPGDVLVLDLSIRMKYY